MSGIGDLLKSGAGSIVDAVSDKLGVDPSTVQSLVEKVMPGADAGEAPAEGAESGGIMSQVSSLLDQDGDGNPINDIAGIAGKLFGGNK